jgi:hypothetical protein
MPTRVIKHAREDQDVGLALDKRTEMTGVKRRFEEAFVIFPRRGSQALQATSQVGRLRNVPTGGGRPSSSSLKLFLLLFEIYYRIGLIPYKIVT